MTTDRLGEAIRVFIKEAGFKFRPYTLRSYFATQMMLAESKGKSLKDYRVFWMGHVGDIESLYTVNRQSLPTEIIEDMRDAYSRCLPYLETGGTQDTQDKVRVELKRQLLLIAGYSEEEINKIDVEGLTDTQYQEMARKRLIGASAIVTPQTDPTRRSPQKVVSADLVERMIGEGWEYIGPLGNKFILRGFAS